jgi:hypothetical protein
MDILNTFLVFNIVATMATLIAFFSMRDTVTDTFGAIKARFSGFNLAGAAGAATSMVLLASVAQLFR